MTGNAPAAARSGNRARRWERGLLAALAGLSALAWLVTWRWPIPGMRLGVLTGSEMRGMGGADGTAPMALGLFLLTWVVMMAAMMLPAAAPVVLAVGRWARRSGRSPLATFGFIAGYLADWSAAGLGAYAVSAGLEQRYPSPGPSAVRAGAVLLVVAGLWQLTPVKHACLRRCRSPLAFLAASTGRLSRSRLGPVRAGVWHGAFCLGCCWSLMLVLLLLGTMNLAWMALVAAVVSAEKILPSGRVVAAAAAAALIASGAALFAVPHLLTALPGFVRRHGSTAAGLGLPRRADAGQGNKAISRGLCAGHAVRRPSSAPSPGHTSKYSSNSCGCGRSRSSSSSAVRL